MLTPQPNQYTPLDIQKGVIDMPARIDTQGYVRVTFPGFDKPLTSWRGQKVKDMSFEQKDKIVWIFNELILGGQYDAVKMWFPKERAKFLIKKVAYEWLDHKGKRPGTLHEQKRIIEKYILPHNGKQSVKELVIQDFDWIRQEHGDTHHARQIRSFTQAILNYCWKRGMMDKQLYIWPINVGKKPTPYIELEDRWLIHSKVDPLYQDPLAVAIEMGMRVGEIVALKPDALDLKRNQIRIIRALSGYEITDMRKGGDEIWLPLDMPYIEHTQDILGKRNLQSKWIFPAPKGGFIWPGRVSNAFKAAARGIGLPQATLHQCRHSFAQDRLQEYPPHIVQALLGHKAIKTTEGYVGTNIRKLKRVREVYGHNT